MKFKDLPIIDRKVKDPLVIALGGNALLKRGEEMTMDNQRRNISQGMKVLLVDLDPQGNATMGSGVDKHSLLVIHCPMKIVHFCCVYAWNSDPGYAPTVSKKGSTTIFTTSHLTFLHAVFSSSHATDT